MTHLYFVFSDNTRDTKKLNIFQVIATLKAGYSLELIK